MSYLSEFHPEVFLVTPRPGGVANILPPDELAAAAPSLKLGGRGSRTTLKSTRSARSTTTTKSTGTTKSLFDGPQFTSTPGGPVCRDFRIRKVVSASPWVLFDDEEEADSPLPPNPIFDTMTILAITISTVMLMAAEYADISEDHLKWTLSYLECVRDEYGNYPPNIRSILNNIRLLNDNLASFNENPDADKELKPAPPEPEPAEEGA